MSDGSVGLAARSPAVADTKAGERCLALSEATIDTPLGPSAADLAGSIITFEVPNDADVTVTSVVPFLRCARRRARAVVHLTDGEGRVIETVTCPAGGPSAGVVTIEELLPAGSGTVTRMLRASTTRGGGVANAQRAGVVVLQATCR